MAIHPRRLVRTVRPVMLAQIARVPVKENMVGAILARYPTWFAAAFMAVVSLLLVSTPAQALDLDVQDDTYADSSKPTGNFHGSAAFAILPSERKMTGVINLMAMRTASIAISKQPDGDVGATTAIGDSPFRP